MAGQPWGLQVFRQVLADERDLRPSWEVSLQAGFSRAMARYGCGSTRDQHSYAGAQEGVSSPELSLNGARGWECGWRPQVRLVSAVTHPSTPATAPGLEHKPANATLRSWRRV